MFATVAFIGVIGIANSETHTCTSGTCVYNELSAGDIVICTDTATECAVTCSNKDQCKKKNGQVLKIYSGAATTTVNCLNENSCVEMELNIGVPYSFDIPELIGYNVEDFNGPKMGFTTINCDGKSSCKDSTVRVNGDFIEKIVLNADGLDSFKDSQFECMLEDTQKCDLNCNGALTCDDVLFSCANLNECQCFGSDCPNITRTCKADPCIIRPIGNEIVVCTNKYNDCIIDCSYEKEACKYENNAVFTVYSGSNHTTIQCNNDSSCIGSDFRLGEPLPLLMPRGFTMNDFNGKKESIVVNCDERSGCKSARIEANGDINNVVLYANNYDSMKDGDVIVDLMNHQTFQLFCSDIGLNGCTQTMCYCGPGTSCSCNGQDCANLAKTYDVYIYIYITGIIFFFL